MTKSMLFYQNVTPVNKERHAKWAVESSKSFDFARDINSVPLAAVEFPSAAREFPVVFARNQEGTIPIAVLGVRNNENLVVDAEGHWQSKYIPAFVRRYPFVFSTADEGETLTLCLDEDHTGCNPEGRGERLFEDDGTSTPYLNKVVEFLQEYQGHFRRTEQFCKKLEDLELLVPMGADFKTADGQSGSLKGFFVVSREKLKELPADKLAELAKTDELEMIYLHLHSMQNLNDLIRRVSSGQQPESTS